MPIYSFDYITSTPYLPQKYRAQQTPVAFPFVRYYFGYKATDNKDTFIISTV
jgi:hypothetical protein